MQLTVLSALFLLFGVFAVSAKVYHLTDDDFDMDNSNENETYNDLLSTTRVPEKLSIEDKLALQNESLNIPANVTAVENDRSHGKTEHGGAGKKGKKSKKGKKGGAKKKGGKKPALVHPEVNDHAVLDLNHHGNAGNETTENNGNKGDKNLQSAKKNGKHGKGKKGKGKKDKSSGKKAPIETLDLPAVQDEASDNKVNNDTNLADSKDSKVDLLGLPEVNVAVNVQNGTSELTVDEAADTKGKKDKKSKKHPISGKFKIRRRITLVPPISSGEEHHP